MYNYLIRQPFVRILFDYIIPLQKVLFVITYKTITLQNII